MTISYEHNNGFLFIYPFRKMIVLSSVSCNANLGKVERTVLNFSMIPHHALRLCLKEKRSRACVHIYSMMSMHEEAVALSGNNSIISKSGIISLCLLIFRSLRYFETKLLLKDILNSLHLWFQFVSLGLVEHFYRAFFW